MHSNYKMLRRAAPPLLCEAVMKIVIRHILVASLLTLTGCSDGPASAASGGSSSASNDGSVTAPNDNSSVSSHAAQPSSRGSGSTTTRATLPDRSVELTNPEDTSMVMLYYSLAGIAPPIDKWVERDKRVNFAPAHEKAGQRVVVRSEFDAAYESLRNVGLLRLTMGAQLSDFDPSYNEYTIRALAPSSTIEYRAYDYRVNVRFANGLDAQIWKISPQEAQVVRDKISYGSANLDVLLRITGTQPTSNGGTITTQVLEYELRESLRGTVLGRVKVSE